MPEIKGAVPLAKFDNDEWDEFSEFQSSNEPNKNTVKPLNTTAVVTTPNENDLLDNMSDTTDNLEDSFSTSLEDLVNTFDEKITKCFHNYEDEVQEYAPVQVRSQEEIMSDCQMWWTLTGNFGNLLPIDWSKTHARQKLLPVLNLNQLPNQATVGGTPSPRDVNEEDESVAQDLDMHQLILEAGDEAATIDQPLKTAEEVIREIDDIMQEGSSSDDEPSTSSTMESSSFSQESNGNSLRPIPPPMHHNKLETLSNRQLNDTVMELESIISEYSETLISQLALRDELEYQKELKNTFISLLLQVQNKRRTHNVDKKKLKKSTPDLKYLTTVIPYVIGHGPPEDQTLQILNKILRAINENSPTVPNLLTDYILRVICPS